MREGETGRANVAEQIELEGRLPRAVVKVIERAGRWAATIVNQRENPAEGRDRGVNHARNVDGFSHVRDRECRFVPGGRFDFGRRAFKLRRAATAQHDTRTL